MNRRASDNRLRIIVLGYLIRLPQGGLAWHYLNYVHGLAELGHDVYYIEDSYDRPGGFEQLLLRTDSVALRHRKSWPSRSGFTN